MQKTKIEWCDFTINPVKGKCPMACPYCYARRMYDRFKWNPKIRFEPEKMLALTKMPDGSRVFWGSTIELFHDSINSRFLKQIFTACKIQNNLIHIFLTKQSQNLIKWSPFPKNCWIGVSATDYPSFVKAWDYLYAIKATIRFISFEPLLDLNDWGTSNIYYGLKHGNINWVIIGQQTPVSAKTQPKIEWIQEIVEAADKAKIPVFLKNNLENLLLGNTGLDLNWKYPNGRNLYLRQEFP